MITASIVKGLNMQTTAKLLKSHKDFIEGILISCINSDFRN